MNKDLVKSYTVITIGCILYALAFDWFYTPNELTCGGLTGIAQILNLFFPKLPIGITVLIMNIPLFFLGFKRFGFGFLMKSLYAMVLSSALVDLIAVLHRFHSMDEVLASLYGGILLGLAGGLMMREEATTGGTELASWLVKHRVPNLSLGNVLLGLDLAVILTFAVAFGNLNNALYGGVALFVTTKVIDFIVYGANTAKLIFIVSDHEEEITNRLLTLELGVTKISSTGAYTNTDRQLLLCAVRRRETVLVKRLVKDIDPNAFFILCDAKEVLGEGFGEYQSNMLG